MGTDPVRILLVEDNPGDAGLIQQTFEETRAGHYEIEHVDRLSQAIARLAEVDFDLVLLDLGLPDSKGLDTFAALQATAPDLAVVVLTGNRDESQGSEAVQAGAQDYLVKGAIAGVSFLRSLDYAIERHRVQQELRQLNEELELRVEARTRELGESERKYRTLVDQSLQGIVIAQGERPRLEYANPAMGAILGYAPQELMELDSDQTMQVIHPDDRAMFLRTYRRRIQGDPALHFEFRGLRRDGETRWLAVSTARIDFQGSHAVLATFVDVTDRRNAERALAAEKERLAVTVSSIGDGVIATDTSGCVVLINRAAQELTGWSEAEATGLPLADVFRCQEPENRSNLPDPVAQVLRRDEVVGFANDVLLIDRSGDEWMVSRTGAPIRDAQGAPIGVVLGFRDQSDRVLWEEERSRREKAESLGVLADGIAHDFNNILTGILGNVSLAKVHAHEGDGLWKRLSEAERALDQATRLVRQLMSLSRSGSPVTEAASIEDIVEQSASLAMSGSRSRYELVAQDGLWAVKVDTTQISRVVQNLVINAEQAMDKGGLLAIGLSNVVLEDPSPFPLEPGRYVKASFRDEGCGIAPALLTKIFDPYVTTKSSGTGLGLAVAFSNVAQHGGHITLEHVDFDRSLVVYRSRPAGVGRARLPRAAGLRGFRRAGQRPDPGDGRRARGQGRLRGDAAFPRLRGGDHPGRPGGHRPVPVPARGGSTLRPGDHRSDGSRGDGGQGGGRAVAADRPGGPRHRRQWLLPRSGHGSLRGPRLRGRVAQAVHDRGAGRAGQRRPRRRGLTDGRTLYATLTASRSTVSRSSPAQGWASRVLRSFFLARTSS